MDTNDLVCLRVRALDERRLKAPDSGCISHCSKSDEEIFLMPSSRRLMPLGYMPICFECFKAIDGTLIFLKNDDSEDYAEILRLNPDLQRK
jgi:hypothetical protein